MNNDRRFMSMQLLGDNLSTLRKNCTATNCRFSWNTTRYLGQEMLRALKEVHTVGYIHRDVKPSNFAMGRAELSDSRVYIIDFGLAKRYKDPRTGRHIPFKDNKQLTGTARYASLNTHLGIE